MPYMLPRPDARFDPGAGLLAAEHFQMAYATNDIVLAEKLFSDTLGIGSFRMLGGPLPEGGEIKALFAWVGTQLYELIQAWGPGSEIYMSRLPEDGGFHIKHHHLGFLVHDGTQWAALLDKVERSGLSILRHSRNPLVEVCFVDVPVLGHYLEYLWPTEAGLTFFEEVPRY